MAMEYDGFMVEVDGMTMSLHSGTMEEVVEAIIQSVNAIIAELLEEMERPVPWERTAAIGLLLDRLSTWAGMNAQVFAQHARQQIAENN